MSPRHIFFLLLQLFGWLNSSEGQRSGYSLQAAVDELHRREAAKFPLNAPPPSTQQRFVGGAFLGGSPQDQDYWDEDSDGSSGSNSNNRNRHKLNKILAKYLERENYDADHGGLTLGPFGGYEFDEDNNNLFLNYPEEKKRSSYFRERDNKWSSDNTPSSIFRERDSPASPNSGADHAELTDQFLREIEESQELEREARYKDALRRLWEKYQQQENELDGNLHEEYKRMIANPNLYMGPLMQKKRSYPVLPWLPYSSRQKRVPSMQQPPVKRSPSENSNFGKTDEKVAWELSELFGGPSVEEEKKKRSTDEQLKVTPTHVAEKPTATTTQETHSATTTSNDTKASTSTAGEHVQHADHGEQARHELGHKHEHFAGDQRSHHQHKRSNHHSHGDSHEDCDESEEHDEHDEREREHEHEEEEDDDEHDGDENDEDEEDGHKKKRDVSSSGGAQHRRVVNKVDQNSPDLPTDLKSRSKKSIQWAKYFGIDRKKKDGRMGDILKKKRSTDDDEDNEHEEKRNFDPDKLDNMDKKLQAIEDLIIDDTIKYTGAHEGVANPEEIRRLKDHVLSRLATAYSLEKMRRALEKLRQSVDNENHLLRNVIENESKIEDNEALEQQKRLSVKKEKVQYDNQHLIDPAIEKSKELHSNAMTSSTGTVNNNHSDNSVAADDEDMKMKKKKRRNNGYLRYPELQNDFADFEPELGAGHYETLNDAYLGNKNYIWGSNQCPLIESMAERCRNVDLLSGDVHQELLPICGIHQICYLCGTSQVACDYQYLVEADGICGRNNDCQAAARSVLMVLRGTSGPQLGPKECLKNSCLYSAMREIGL